MRQINWRWVLAGIALASAALFAIAAVKAGYACTNVNKRAAMKIVEANGCIEFWFNRYQSLIGNVLTALVAGITLLWIARQLEVSHRESAISAASALRARVEELNNAAAVMDRALACFRTDWHWLFSTEPSEFARWNSAQIAKLDVYFDQAREIRTSVELDQLAGNSEESDADRDRVVSQLTYMMRAFDALKHCAKNLHGSWDPETGAAKAITARLREADMHLDRTGSCVSSLRRTLADELKAVWAEIRRLERRAIAHR